MHFVHAFFGGGSELLPGAYLGCDGQLRFFFAPKSHLHRVCGLSRLILISKIGMAEAEAWGRQEYLQVLVTADLL